MRGGLTDGPGGPRLALAALLVAAFLIRIANLEAHGLWFDEMLSLNNALGSLRTEPFDPSAAYFSQTDLWSRNTLANVRTAVVWHESGNAIGYHVVLHYWLAIAGTRDLAVRLLSAVFGTLSVLLVHRLAARLLVGPVAPWAAGVAALHPLLVRYSQEARAYAMATTLALAATLLFVGLVRSDPKAGDGRGGRRWALYGVTSGAALLTHYLVAGVLAAHALFALLAVRDGGLWRRLIGAGAIAGLLLAVWLAVGGREGLTIMEGRNAGYLRRAEAGVGADAGIATTPRAMATGFVQVLYPMTGNTLQSAGLRLRVMLPLLLVPLACLAACARAGRRVERAPGALALLVLIAGSGPAVAAALAARAGHIVSFQPAYVTFATPYVAILLAVGLRELAVADTWRWPRLALVTAQALVIVASLAAVYRDAPWFRPPNGHRAAALEIGALARPGDVVVYPSWTDARLCNAYLPRDPALRQTVDPAAAAGHVKVLRDGVALRAFRPYPFDQASAETRTNR